METVIKNVFTKLSKMQNFRILMQCIIFIFSSALEPKATPGGGGEVIAKGDTEEGKRD